MGIHLLPTKYWSNSVAPVFAQSREALGVLVFVYNNINLALLTLLSNEFCLRLHLVLLLPS